MTSFDAQQANSQTTTSKERQEIRIATKDTSKEARMCDDG
jgi:hypothetical protein